jgi:hypothetical protein
MSRLPASLEAGGLVRRAEADGDFATILRKGDPDRGALLIMVTSRGRHWACLERVLSLESGNYNWRQVGPALDAGSVEISDFLAKRTRFDDDLWLIELDIAEPERFIAETISQG